MVNDTLLQKVFSNLQGTAQRLFNATPVGQVANFSNNFQNTQQSLQKFGQYHPTATNFITKNIEPQVQKVSSFMQEPYKPISLPSAQVQAPKNAPWLAKLPAQIGAGSYNMLVKPMVEGIINSPADYVGGITRTGLDIGKMGRGEKVPIQQTLGDVGSVGRAIFNVAMIPGVTGVAKQAASNAIEQGFRATVGAGMRSGMKFGGGYGLVQGLIDNKQTSNFFDYILNVGGSTGMGAVAGGAFGGGIAGVSYGVGKVFGTVVNKLQEIFPNKSKSEIYQDAKGFFHGEAGRFVGINKGKEPMYNSELRKSLGMEEFPNYQKGAIDLNAKVGGKPQAPTGGERVVQIFENSTGQKKVGKLENTNFELGSFGKNSEVRKTPQPDRFSSSELGDTVKNIKGVFNASNDPANYRSGNLAWVAEMPNGERRVIYTRVNKNGAQEILNWHRIDETLNPNFLQTLQSFGAPARNRTGIADLEKPRSIQLTYRDTNSIPQSVNKPEFSQSLQSKTTDIMNPQVMSREIPKGGVPEGKAMFKQPIKGVTPLDQKLPESAASSKVQINKPVLPEVKPVEVGGGQAGSSSGPIIPPTDPIQKVIQALKESKPIRGQQEALYSKARSQQVAKIADMGAKVPGEQGYFAQLGQLKGQLPKVQFEGIRKQITQPDIDSLFNTVEKSNITPFEKITAKTGLAKLLGAEGGTVPTKGEINLLGEIFPPDFIQAVLDKRSTMQKLFTLGEQALNLPRAMMATADLSAPMRQGVFLIGRPKQWVPAFKDMFKYAFNEKSYKGLAEEIKARPTYSLMRENKLALTDMSQNMMSREEAFMSNLSEKIPGFGILAKASNRAYSGFLNKLRADVFDDLVKTASKQGLDVKMIAPDIANFVNSATGRGDLGALNKASVVLNGAFFSPRLMASRLNLLNPIYYAKLNPFVRKEALKSLFTFTGTAMTVAGLAKLGGAQVGTDPRSADFGKIKVGDTRFDPWGGFQQYIVLASRLLTNQMVSSTTGKEFTFGTGYKPTTRFDIVQRFFESKESPVASFVSALLKGQNSMGEKTNLPVEIIDRFIPMVTQDMYDLYKENGLPGLAMAIPGIFGVGSQTYTDQIPMTGKTPMGKPNVQWRTQPGLGETLLNKVTGTQISNIPQDQWKPLIDQRQAQSQWDIKYSGIKAEVLNTGTPQTVVNPITNKTIDIFLKDGVVTTKDVTPKTIPTKKSSSSKAGKKLAKVTFKKPIFRKSPKIKTPKFGKFKIKKIKFKNVKPVKYAKLKVKGGKYYGSKS